VLYPILTYTCTRGVLMLMSVFRPTTVESLTELEDIAEEKAMKYGDSFLECIKEFCSERDWPTDKPSTSLPVDSGSQVCFTCRLQFICMCLEQHSDVSCIFVNMCILMYFCLYDEGVIYIGTVLLILLEKFMFIFSPFSSDRQSTPLVRSTSSYRIFTAACPLVMVNSKSRNIETIDICMCVMWMWLQSMPTDAELMQLSDSVRGSYILFERDHKSLVCNVLN